MGINLDGYHQHMKPAVEEFWTSRTAASRSQKQRGVADQGNRSGVTAGKNLDGFCRMVHQLIVDNGIPADCIHTTGRAALTLPGFFRPTKNWDLLVIKNKQLLAAIEFKSQVGPSFGNNFNNRVEEALGNASDILTAYREGVFGDIPKPFLGYFFVLEDCEASNRLARFTSPHFGTFPEFADTGYAQRYDLLCRKLIKENIYDAASLTLTNVNVAKQGNFRSLSDLSSPHLFARTLAGRMASLSDLIEGG
jgi:hypothetical protein